MIVSISERESYATGERYACLITDGCGCCANDKPATLKNIDAAIKEHEDFIEELKELRAKQCLPVNAEAQSPKNEQS